MLNISGVTMEWLLRLVTGGASLVVFHILFTYCCISMIFCYSLVSSLILNTFSIRFVVLLASDSLARSSKFLLISASYLLF